MGPRSNSRKVFVKLILIIDPLMLKLYMIGMPGVNSAAFNDTIICLLNGMNKKAVFLTKKVIMAG